MKLIQDPLPQKEAFLDSKYYLGNVLRLLIQNESRVGVTTVQAQCEAKANDHWRTVTGLLPGLSFQLFLLD